MRARLLGLTTVLILGFTVLAHAQSVPPDPSPRSGVAAETPAEVRKPARRAAQRSAKRPEGYRSAKYHGGRGATWREGRDRHGFQGSFGGCQYRGVAGPDGYRLDQRC
ncbi:MAG TPA: hypothetical protein VF641_03645 [Methylobacterium sp.]|jgi:hypothetical protein